MARPRQFDAEQVVQRAMDYFWEHGYRGSSIRDLTGHLRIQRGSLYNSFTDKRALFVAALSHYGDHVMAEARNILDHPHAGLKELRALIASTARTGIAGRGPCGCLFLNTLAALPPGDQDIRALIQSYQQRMEQSMHGLLQRARDRGEIDRDRDLPVLAATILASLQGILMLARAGRPASELAAIATLALAVLDS